ncbi:hypothetical protein FHW36_104338 [Chitinophaga polysaccharea]|uniref:Natural product n=1 Tax=Chitinophaga polysaccharea TaxID=1293035 RepID=A0A561PRA8_9BACT|nr:hypothetical protein [Chitinophaga polysaccharea]TWF40655.1 hypothetical protein FHW36_104338 [Chitinophaga polysaccharea]
MKKLKLKALDLGAKELLTREQLKNVMGGDGSGTKDCTNDCGEALGECPEGLTCKSQLCDNGDYYVRVCV